MKASLKWDGHLGFEAVGESGRPIVTDASVAAGGRGLGPSPMELVLFGLGGCMGIDVVSILQKARVELTTFTMELEGERAPEHPRGFTKIKIRLHLEGKGLNETVINRAINLSMEKYCSVRSSLKAEVETEYTFVEL
ncbi:OsmC family protein [Capillibacterium thermochitinicola]|uniref:OsmC family protein n=1 Tax=Capillibacterium thermochitinicola TaxID=2699427 RepID=A0A8J6LRG6_9FIRM|nr:OsmC family protein [Capillibacterium thermochitinicola]MBA2132077.1 OsmC family protein [Capillibacterium thermochitinicola]